MCSEKDTNEDMLNKTSSCDVIEAPQQVNGRTSSQILACMSVSLGCFAAGTGYGWTAGTLHQLKEDSEMVMDTASTAWVVSIISLGCIIGSLISARVSDWFGRRTTLLLTSPILLGGWIIMALAHSVAIILAGRLICGIATAFIFSTVSVYCSESTEARLRGRLGTMTSLFITLGVAFSYIAGVFCTWRVSCYACAVPTVIMFIFIFIIPESPYWYLLKSKKQECRDSLKWLRGPDYNFEKELEEMEEKMNSVGTKMECRELFRPRTRKPFLVSIFMSTLPQVSGGNILMMFTGVIFISAGVENHRMATLYTGLVQIIFTVLCVLTVDHLGRRALIIASMTIIGVATLVLGAHYYVNTLDGAEWPASVPLVTILIAVSGYCLGCRSLPWLLSSELFNTTVRSTAHTANIFYNRILNLITIQIYPFFEEAFGAHTVFFTFGGLSLLASLLAYFIVPETKGKTLEEIQEHFESKSNDKKEIEDEIIKHTHATAV